MYTTHDTEFRRYALYVMAPPDLHAMASAWLGWDSVTGVAVPHLQPEGLLDTPEKITATPRKYGFHATIKPPFRLAKGETQSSLDAVCKRVLAALPPVEIKLAVKSFKGFVAMVPAQPSAALEKLAADVVEQLDGLRAPLNAAELERRRKSGLTDRQEALLAKWGYPGVMEEFQFHMTLSGKLDAAHADQLAAVLSKTFADVIPNPFRIDTMGLLGEDKMGRFHFIQSYTLTGKPYAVADVALGASV
ncbi:MAG: DUF1045 domain-containing protein [Pseudomonadota bacterium]